MRSYNMQEHLLSAYTFRFSNIGLCDSLFIYLSKSLYVGFYKYVRMDVWIYVLDNMHPWS